ncbi:MAG: YqaJ viral recombinase family protein [Oscillospiraceae bacterium]|nr:YqaJ viral recombinase family protein [Oscillospiraceae bacterium]
MSRVKVCRVPDITHEEWLAYRRTGIGGSDASTIVGLNPYSSLYYLYNDKLGLLAPKDDTEAMRQGRDLEQYVADRWMEATGKKCQRNNYMWRSVEHPFMLADIDREVVGENAGLECKTTSVYNRHDFEGGEVPLTYYVQCQHYMAVMGFDRMYLAVLVLNRGFYHYVIQRDEDEIAALIEEERGFWEGHILPQEPPPVDGSDATRSALRQRWPEEEDGTWVYLDTAADHLLGALESVQREIKALKESEETLKAGLMAALGECAVGQSDRWEVSWRTQTRTGVDSRRLKKEWPAVYEACKTVSTARVLRTKKKKEEL